MRHNDIVAVWKRSCLRMRRRILPTVATLRQICLGTVFLTPSTSHAFTSQIIKSPSLLSLDSAETWSSASKQPDHSSIKEYCEYFSLCVTLCKYELVSPFMLSMHVLCILTCTACSFIKSQICFYMFAWHSLYEYMIEKLIHGDVWLILVMRSQCGPCQNLDKLATWYHTKVRLNRRNYCKCSLYERNGHTHNSILERYKMSRRKPSNFFFLYHWIIDTRKWWWCILDYL